VGASLRIETELYCHLFNRAANQVGLASLTQPPVAYLAQIIHDFAGQKGKVL